MAKYFLVKLKTVDQVSDDSTSRSPSRIIRLREYLVETAEHLSVLSRYKYGEGKGISFGGLPPHVIDHLLPSAHPEHKVYFVVDSKTANFLNLNNSNEAVDYCVELDQ